jgi:hypothetical protein
MPACAGRTPRRRDRARPLREPRARAVEAWGRRAMGGVQGLEPHRGCALAATAPTPGRGCAPAQRASLAAGATRPRAPDCRPALSRAHAAGCRALLGRRA